MNEIIRKLTSRKFIMALVGMVLSFAMANGVEGSELVEVITVIGKMLSAVALALGYINGEAKVDAARELSKSDE